MGHASFGLNHQDVGAFYVSGPAPATWAAGCGRLLLAAGLLLALGAALVSPEPARAQTHCDSTDSDEIWCANLTVGEALSNLLGYVELNGTRHGSLTDTSFDYVGNSYTVANLDLSGGTVTFQLSSGSSQAIFQDSRFSLSLGTTTLSFSDAALTTSFKWTSTGLSWSSGDTIAVKLKTTGNSAPTVANAIPDQTAYTGAPFSYTVPAGTFADANSDTLTYSISLSDGSDLPSWLSYGRIGRIFSGTPPTSDVGTITVRVTVNDGHGGSVHDDFDLVVATAPMTDTAMNLVSNTEQNTIDPGGGTTDTGQLFHTGDEANGYLLTAVVVVSADSEGDAFDVRVCPEDDTSNEYPTTDCTALTAPSAFPAGNLTFTHTGLPLAADTNYVVVVDPRSSAVDLIYTNTTAEDSSGQAGWSIKNRHYWQSSGGTWNTTSHNPRALKIGVRGTVGAGTMTDTMTDTVLMPTFYGVGGFAGAGRILRTAMISGLLRVWVNYPDVTPGGLGTDDLTVTCGSTCTATVVEARAATGAFNADYWVTIEPQSAGAPITITVNENAITQGNAAATHSGLTTAAPFTFTMSTTATEPVQGDFTLTGTFSEAALTEGEIESLLEGAWPRITNPTLRSYPLKIDNGTLLSHGGHAASSLTTGTFRIRPKTNFRGTLTVTLPAGSIRPFASSRYTARRNVPSNNPAVFTIEVDTAVLPEVNIAAGSGVLKGESAEFTLTRIGGDMTQPLTVQVTVAETGDVVAASNEGAKTVTLAANTATATYTVATVTGMDELASDVTVTITADSPATYTLGTPASATVSVTAASAPPRVASIERQSPATSPTNADSLTWRVTFNKAVQNVTAADFALTGTTATVQSATADGSSTTVYAVTASGGDLAGLDNTVTLGFACTQDITDLADGALADTAPTGTNDHSYVLDNTAPTVAISGVPATSEAPFTARNGDTGFTALITPTADGEVTIDVAAAVAQDTAGNDNAAAPQVTSTYTAPVPVLQAPPPAVPNTPATGEPLIAGLAQVGAALTASTDAIRDADGLTRVEYRYQWVRVDADGMNPMAIPGATASAYTLTPDDAGRRVQVMVTFTDDAGHAETRPSAAYPPDGTVNTPATGAPAIAGEPQVGETLTASPGDIMDADGLDRVTFAYQWVRVDADGMNPMPRLKRLRGTPGQGAHLTVGGYRLPLDQSPRAAEARAPAEEAAREVARNAFSPGGQGPGEGGEQGAGAAAEPLGWLTTVLTEVARVLGMGPDSAAPEAPWLGDRPDPRVGRSRTLDPGQTLTLRRVLLGSSFRLHLNAAEDDGALPPLTAWGGVAGTTFTGLDGTRPVDGDVLTGTVGVDGAWGDWLAGVAVAHSRGEGGATLPGLAGRAPVTSTLLSTLTSVHPYLRYAVTDHLDVWGLLGYGWGTAGGRWRWRWRGTPGAPGPRTRRWSWGRSAVGACS